jgi:hypothetical protein
MNEYNLALLAEYGEEYRQDYADDDACGERKIEAELFSFNKYVTRQAPDARDLVGKGKPQTYYNEERTKYNKCPAYSRHFSHFPDIAKN